MVCGVWCCVLLCVVACCCVLFGTHVEFPLSRGGVLVEQWSRFKAKPTQSARLGSLGSFCETPAACPFSFLLMNSFFFFFFVFLLLE